jgi:hypothetical protein
MEPATVGLRWYDDVETEGFLEFEWWLREISGRKSGTFEGWSSPWNSAGEIAEFGCETSGFRKIWVQERDSEGQS